MTFRGLGDGLPVNQVGGLEFYPKKSYVFSPADIDGLQLWLKADAGTFQDSGKTTPAASDGDVVGAWADQSGLGNDALQATTADKPLLKLAIVNGKDVARFDGVNDSLGVADNAGLKPANLTLFAAIKLNVSLSAQAQTFPMLIDKYQNTVGGYGFLFDKAGDSFTFRTMTAVFKDVLITGANAAFGTSAHVVTGWFDGNTRKVNLDGIEKNSVAETFTLLHTTEPLLIGEFSGANLNINADVMEVILYNSALSASLVTEVEAYLKSRYGIV